jgi:hypothetical protein
MRLSLRPHPDTPCRAVTSLEAEVVRSGGELSLAYTLTGAIADLILPPPSAPARTDELWRHTCFEAFVGPAGEAGYVEVNLAPSTEWAAYRFSGYREGMSPADVTPPHIEVRRDDVQLVLTASLALRDLLADAPWRLGLSAVIETADGARSYWALAHPPGKPDFHHAAGFAMTVA